MSSDARSPAGWAPPAGGTAIRTADVRAREEDFGWIVALPDGDIDLYDASVAPLLAAPTFDTQELDRHRLRELAFESEQFHLRHPLIVTVEVSTKCELRCKHCFIDAGHARENELTRSELFALVDDLHRCGVFCIQFLGGEPLEHPDFLDVLDYAHGLGFVLSFVTNGLRLTPEVVDRLPRKDFGMGLSIDGIASNAAIRGKASTFDIVSEKAILLKEAGIDFNVVFTLNATNIGEATELVDWCRDNDIMLETLETQPIGRARHARGLQLTPNDVEADLAVYDAKEELEDYFEECVDPRDRLYYADFLQLAYWLDSLTERCKGARSIAYIASDGTVYPCSNCAGESILDGGSIRDVPFSLLWAHSFREMRDITWSRFGACQGCALSSAEYSCSGRCPPLSHALNRTYDGCGATPYTMAIVKARTAHHVAKHGEATHMQANPARVIRVVGGES